MTIEDAIKHYGTSKEIARLLRKSPGRISQFKAAGGFVCLRSTPMARWSRPVMMILTQRPVPP